MQRHHGFIPHVVRLALAGGVLSATPVLAQVAPPAATPTLQEVVVTGSMIRRTDLETPSPVTVLTADDLRRSGFTDLSDVLRNLPANGQGTLSQSFNGAFAGGASGIALRGLTVGATLVLIDGERMVAYPLADDGQRSFVDISAIPFNAVERIEVLRDGASAEYGSDAIAGVVNVILKKTVTGFEATAEGGRSKYGDGTTTHLAGIWGAGDLAVDGYNAFVSLELRRQRQVLLADRHGAFTNLDWRSQGGIDTRPGAYVPDYNPYPGSITGYLIDPEGNIGAFLPGCDAGALAGAQCTYAVDGLQLQPDTRNANVLGRFTKNLAESWQLTVSASLFHSEAQQANNYSNTGYPDGLYGIAVGPGVNPALPPGQPLVITVPADYPGNPYAAPAPLVYNFHELGPQLTKFSTDTYRLFVDVRGGWRGWDVDGAFGAMSAATTQRIHGVVDPLKLQAALDAGYRVGATPSAGGAGLFAPAMKGVDHSRLQVADLRATRAIATLSGGPLSLGVGIGYQHRVLDSLAAPEIASGAQPGNNAFATGNQSNVGLYAEVVAPLLRHLELDAAVRYDHYDTYGSSTTPKFGIKYTPIPALALRATWGQGFRAPNPAEAGQAGQSFYVGSGPDPVLCPNAATPSAAGNFPSQCQVGFQYFQRSNPALKPVTSTSYTAGFVLEPRPTLSVAVDYYDIKINRDIVAGSGDFDNPARGAPLSLPYCTADGVCDGNASTGAIYGVGPILYVPATYINANSTHTSGVDVDLKASTARHGWGRATVELNVTHLFRYDLTIDGVRYELAGTHGPMSVSGDTGNPKERAALTLGWERQATSLSATLNYVSAFASHDPSFGQPDCASAQYGSFATKFLSGSSFPDAACKVAHFTELDVYGRWRLADHWAVHGSIVNLFNREPPLDYTTYGGAGNAAYNPALHQVGAIGRFFTIGATYAF
jgi:iron complex outermembrane receptor protein